MSSAFLNFPFDAAEVLRKKRSLLKKARELPVKINKKIAILGGSSTGDLRDFLEIFLRQIGVGAEFYESEYGKFYEDALFGTQALDDFHPDLIFIATTSMNINSWPNAGHSVDEAHLLRKRELAKFQEVWRSIEKNFSCLIIQNNFEEPLFRPLGSLSFSEPRGRVHYTRLLNEAFAQYQQENKKFFVNDIHYLSAWYGLERWYDRRLWHSYKYAMAMGALPLLAHQTANLIGAAFGLSHKALVLDLDNTIWGGVIGDDGLNGIQIGKETPEAEAYTEFQEYIAALHERGILLAVCSKNDLENAESGFTHPDSVLVRSKITAFEANWDPKNENINKISKTLNIGLDSLVFVDDNPAERDLVRSQVPSVAVPEIGSDISRFAVLLDKAGYFETTFLSEEDLRRNRIYQENEQRVTEEKAFENYEDFLKSLKMRAEISGFSPIYLERISQLTNKTNQFNLTTRRYTIAEIENLEKSVSHITLYGRLADRFGDHGLVSVIVAEVKSQDALIDLWLMSCRVLKRDMEKAMMDALAEAAQKKGLRRLIGTYIPTAKNSMVLDHYKMMGFSLLDKAPSGITTWEYRISPEWKAQNNYIE